MLSECFLKFRGGFPGSQPALPVLPISTGVFTINAGSESSLSDWLNRHGVLCHHQDLWPVEPLGSSPASWPPHWAGWLRAPSLTTPRITGRWVLGAAVRSYLPPHGYGQGILVLVQEEGGSVTAPGRPMEGAPSPQRPRTPHGDVGDHGGWGSLSARPVAPHPLNKGFASLWKQGGCRAGEIQEGPVWRRGLSGL